MLYPVESALFLEEPHDSLYGAVWTEDNRLRPEARDVLRGTVLELLEANWPDAREWVRFAIIGSGASYNWDETGDLDVQVWVADESKLGDVRRLIVRNLLGITCAELGLDDPPGTGAMEVQWYAKPGRGTPRENMDGQPYACYDIDLDVWLVEPYPLTPEMYANQFLLVEDRATEIAEEAESLLARYSRAQSDLDYWTAVAPLAPNHDSRLTSAQRRLAEVKADLKAFYQQLVAARGEAYQAGGRGIHDERDAIWKLLQVWGLMDRLKAAAK